MFHVGIEVVEAVDAVFFVYEASVGGDGFVVWYGVEAEIFLQVAKLGNGETYRLFVGEPFLYVFVVCLASLGCHFSYDEHELHVVTLGYLCS